MLEMNLIPLSKTDKLTNFRLDVISTLSPDLFDNPDKLTVDSTKNDKRIIFPTLHFLKLFFYPDLTYPQNIKNPNSA